jgi:predicted O-methyltransferase YrrM
MLNIPSPQLRTIHDNGFIDAPSGERVPISISGAIDWTLAEALYRTVRNRRPSRALEVGMASGISSLCILTAMAENGPEGSLVSIDPNQSTGGRRAGINHVAQAGFAARHRLMEEPDYAALPRLLAEGATFDFIYIDGNHDFDYVVLDAFYADLLLVPGGVVGFNDCSWRSVHAALKQVPIRSRYEEIDVGLRRNYRSRNIVGSIERCLTGRSSSDRYFQKKQNFGA